MRSPNRKHERQSFFKYMPAATARLVLTHCTLRWSSPILFNDPFDVPRELSFGVQPEEIVQALAGRVARLIQAPPEDTSMLEPRLRLIVDAVRNGVAPELKQELLAGIAEVAGSLRPTSAAMDELREMWRNLLPDHRILCLTESPAHAAMWYHYADQYRGAVLEFRCVDELDSAWLLARPVTYPASKPAIYSADGWAEILTMPHQLAVQTILHTATYTKSPDWSYESEWRVASFRREADTGPFTDYKFAPIELAAVYLGPNMSADDRVALRAAAAAFPATKVKATAIGLSREFQFDDAGA